MPTACAGTSRRCRAFGATPDGGVARTTFSEPHLAVRSWFLEQGRAAGLEPRVDSAANHSVVLPARDPGARTLMLGSHLDSVRRGGRYDGALGVLCALEVVRSAKDAELDLPVALEAVDFTDEEGTLIGLLGSWAMSGILTKEILAAPRGGRELLVAELERMGLTEEGLLAARREAASLAGYLELHIEQGPVLERAGVDIGVVTGIIGSASFNVVFEGDARHAGTTPMDARRDAALGASAFVLGVRDTVVTALPGLRRHGGEHRDGARLVQRRPRPGAAADGVPLARQRRAGRTRAGAHRPRARRGGALRPRRRR